MRKVLKIFGGLIALLFYTGLLIYVLHRPSLKVIAQWKKPDSIHYDGGLNYYLSVVEGDLDWRGFPLNVQRRCFIYVGLDSGEPSYGHTIDFSFYPDQSHYHDLSGYLKGSEVEWNSEGVTIILPSAHHLFIPKSMFTNGR